MATANWTAANIPSQKGKTILITGANSGLGLEASKVLSGKGAHVVMTARNLEKGETAVAEVKRKYPDADVDLMRLDLADFDSIRKFSEEFHSRYSRLHVLIENAGVMNPPKREVTKQNFEIQFGTNHLGHFLITGLLLDVLKRTPHSRIAVQSSGVHKIKALKPDIHFDDLNWENSFKSMQAYSQSKLANLLFAYELDRRLKSHKLDVIVTAAHPGWTKTNLQNTSGFLISGILNDIVAQSVEIGTLPILRAAVEERLVGSEYFGPTGLGELRGYPELVKSSDKSHDGELARKLWDVSEKLTGMTYDFS